MWNHFQFIERHPQYLQEKKSANAFFISPILLLIFFLNKQNETVVYLLISTKNEQYQSVSKVFNMQENQIMEPLY